MLRILLVHFLSAATVFFLWSPDKPFITADVAWGGPLGSGLEGGAKFDRKPELDIRPQDVVQWSAFDALEDAQGNVTAGVRLTLKSDWKIYVANLKFSGPAGFKIIDSKPPRPQKFMDPIAHKEVEVYEGGEFIITFSGAPRWTNKKFPITATYVGCTNVICLFPYTETLDVTFRPFTAPTSSSSASGSSLKSGSQEGLNSPPSSLSSPATPPGTSAAPDSGVAAQNRCQTEAQDAGGDDLEARLAQSLKGSASSYGLLLLIVFVGGILSNLTPCVYPMIPITLRVLSRQGSTPYLSASAYAFGIIVTYTGLGLVAALSGGLFGSILANKSFNIAFAILMIVLGLGMLGFGNFSQIQTLGSKLGSGKPSPRNAFLMGTGAGLVAAPCTGPILAALLAYTTRNENSIVASTLLLFTYSAGFALPYVALGGAAAKVSKVKVHPTIQVGVKIVFASVMFALGLYYLRIPMYQQLESMHGRWQPIALSMTSIGILLTVVWVANGILSGNKISSILPASVLGIGIFASSQWATGTADSPCDPGLHWYKVEDQAFKVARTEGKPLLLDMWAEWCEACKKMDGTTFQDPQVAQELRKNWILVKHDLTELDEHSEKIQTRYNVQSLPTLVLVAPDGSPANQEIIGGYVSAGHLLESLQLFSEKHQ